jgi:acyl dehydratase
MATQTIDAGTPYTQNEGRIDEDAVFAYALATNDSNDAYLRGAAVPPVFTVSLIRSAFAEASTRGTKPGMIRGARVGVHAQHDVHLINPVRPGMAVQWRGHTHCARQTPAGSLVTQRIEVSDTDGTPLVEHYWSTLHVGGHLDADVGPDLPDHTFPQEARERLLGTRVVDVTRDQGFRYAGASGDRNAHCVDDEAARREGFPSKILQGLCTFALCSGVVLNVGANGAPERLRRIAGRFSSPVFPGQSLTVEVFDAGHTPDGAAVLAFEATSNGVTVLKHGRAELHPD